MKERKDIEEKYKWDLSSYYFSEKEFENDYNYVLNNFEKIKLFENKLNNEKDIFDCLDFEKTISKKLSKLYVYSSLITKEDATVSASDERLEKIVALSVKVSASSSFVSVELAELDDNFLLSLLNNPRAKNYDLLIKDIIKCKKHTLSKKEENLLSLMGEFSDGFSDVFDKFDNADITFEDCVDSKGNKYPLNMATYGIYMESEDRELRKNAIKNINGAFGKFHHTIGTNYINHVKKDCFYSKIRNFNSCLESALFSEDVSKDVYDNLVESVNKNLSGIHQYYDLKRQQLNLDKIALYDMSAPTSSSYNLKLDYEDAYELVKTICAPLGEEYVSVLQRAFNERWIDVFANKGKDNGAFSWGCYGENPVVLLNYEKTTNDIFTIAHEMGHAMHTYYSNNNQPYEKAGYEIFVAEVASTVNEMLMVRYQIQNAKSDEEKIYYYDYFLKMFRTTIMRQTMFAEFEKYAHEQHEKGVSLTIELLNNYYYELNKRYFGENVELVDEIKYEWLRIPHFYNSFYVYKYATGLISAVIISEKIFNNELKAKDNYINFLKSGGSQDPVSLLKIAGVDLTKVETFDYAFNVMNKYINEFKNCIN